MLCATLGNFLSTKRKWTVVAGGRRSLLTGANSLLWTQHETLGPTQRN